MSINRWLGATVTAAILATLTTLSVRGWDGEQKYVQTVTCSDLNSNPSNDQWSGTSCVVGRPCVICEQPNFGEVTHQEGTGAVMMGPQNLPCGGDRIIGNCILQNGKPYCDLANSYQDGTCAGVVTKHVKQNQPGGTG
jgi:hypothetical protein